MPLDPTSQAKAALLTLASGTGKISPTWGAATVVVPAGTTATAGQTLTTAQVAALFAIAVTSVANVITTAQGE